MTAAASASSHDGLFASVFPPANFSTPTPEATPEIGVLSSPGRPFGGPLAHSSVADEAVKTSQAWSVATRYLTLQSGYKSTSRDGDRRAADGFAFLLERPKQMSQLLDWYMNEIRLHHQAFVKPELKAWQQPIPASAVAQILQHTISRLQHAQTSYLEPFRILISSGGNIIAEKPDRFANQIRIEWHVVLQHTLPRDRVQKAIALAFYDDLRRSLEDNSNPERCRKAGHCQCRAQLQEATLGQLADVGLAGDLAERALAMAVYRFLIGPAVQRRCFEVDWTGQTSVATKLKIWIANTLVPTTRRAQAMLTGSSASSPPPAGTADQATTAIACLGQLRTRSLFDYVKLWPHSTGAILDIKAYLSDGGTDEKAFVCSSFSNQVRARLLHAGASTTEILSIYINVIHVFRLLDPRGVLLDKVAVPIRQYLRNRDDTVNVIAASFLADGNEGGALNGSDSDVVCTDIAVELENTESEQSQSHKGLNWDDMEWTPDPIDAGPDFKSSKFEDVISHILGLFEQEDFIKEVTNVLAQHLLQATDMEYVRETRLVELMKARFDSTKLQAAEVMLKDVRDSLSLNKRFTKNTERILTAPTPKEIQAVIPSDGIAINSLYESFAGRIERGKFIAALRLVANKRADLWFPKRTRLPAEPSNAMQDQLDKVLPEVKVQVVSSFFWPQMRTETFAMPKQLSDRILEFQEHFERVSGQRRLQMRPALGRVVVELELEDRVVHEENVAAWRASVIDAFAENTSIAAQAERSVDSDGLGVEVLSEHLQMDAELVQDALNFWTTKRVLYRVSQDTYAVLERLDLDIAQAAESQIPQQQQPQDEAFSAIKSQDAMLRENAAMFETFIANMLRNGGAKQVGGMMGITNMLKMVLPTFTYGEEEVKALLEDMELRGEASRSGELWSAS